MAKNPNKKIADFRNKCWELGSKTFLEEISPKEQIEAVCTTPQSLYEHIEALQAYLDKVNPDLFYGSDHSINSIMNDLLSGIIFDVGLVSTMHLSGPAIADRGIPQYRFSVGPDKMWEAYLANKCDLTSPTNISEIKRLLSSRPKNGEEEPALKLPERLFGHRNATGALLSPIPPANIDPMHRVVVPYQHSEGGVAGTGDKFKIDFPWALVSQKSFPMLYAVVQRNYCPLGFLQMHISLPDTVQGDKYTGPESSWLFIYNPSTQWVKFLADLITIYCENFLAPLLERAIMLSDHSKHAIEMGFCFPMKFRKAVNLADNVNVWEEYNWSKWRQQIAHLHSLWKQPAFSPSELAKNIIDLFWTQGSWRSLPTFDKRSEAEKLLFWSEKYRDHLVHVLKVFLVGEKLIHELLNYGPAKAVFDNTPFSKDEFKSSLEAFEFQWMLAATVHDYSLPYELLPGLQRSYWREFVVPEDSTSRASEDSSDRDLEAMQFGLTLADRILRQHLVVSMWQILHSEVMPQGKECYEAYQHLHSIGESPENILYPKFLSYFLEHGDHGIASALWYLHLTMIDSSTTKLKSPKTVPDARLKESIAVARACYFHNLATKRKKNGQASGEKCFAGTLFGPFAKDPLPYLLMLCDFLQDEGRDESENQLSIAERDWSERPFGHVTNIKWENGILRIDVEYLWVPKKTNGVRAQSIQLGEMGCKGKNIINCKRKQKSQPCDWSACQERDNIRKAFELLQERLKGLPVSILLDHDPSPIVFI